MNTNEQAEARACAGVDAEQPVNWGYAGTVGNYIKQLQSIDPSTPIYAGFHADYKGERRAMARGLSVSRERVVGRFIDPSNKTVPYSLVVWASQDESAATREAPAAAPVPAEPVAWGHRQIHQMVQAALHVIVPGAHGRNLASFLPAESAGDLVELALRAALAATPPQAAAPAGRQELAMLIEAGDQLAACHDEPTCPAINLWRECVARLAAQQEGGAS